MILNAADHTNHDCKSMLIRTVDTDVVVLTVKLANKLGCERLHVTMGTGNNFWCLNATRML